MHACAVPQFAHLGSSKLRRRQRLLRLRRLALRRGRGAVVALALLLLLEAQAVGGGARLAGRGAPPHPLRCLGRPLLRQARLREERPGGGTPSHVSTAWEGRTRRREAARGATRGMQKADAPRAALQPLRARLHC